MQARQCISNLGVNNFFISCNELSYIKRIQNKTKDPKKMTPLVLEQSPHKIHISLQNASYLEHRDKLCELVKKHLEAGTINAFKYIENNILNGKIESSTQIINLLLEYQAKQELTPDWENYFIRTINRYFNKNYSLPLEEATFLKMKHQAEALLNDSLRYVDSDQFTIYIPEPFDPAQVLHLCQELNLYLTENQALPGKLIDVASPIGIYLNLRNEFLLIDIQWMNENQTFEMERRINGVKLYNNDFENERRRRVVLEQERSEFYSYLHNHFAAQQLPSLREAPILFQQDEMKVERRASQQEGCDQQNSF